MTEYFPKAEQIDTLNGKLDALNETLKKREDFVSAVAKMEAATSAANTAATNATTAAAGVVSPTATVTKSGTTTTVTVTDKTGTTTAEVKDGSDATVTKDNIVSALGYEPVKPEGNYELIEEITLTEDTSEIVRTQEPDGKAYNFVKMAFLYSNFATAGTGKVAMVLNDNYEDRLSQINLGQQFSSTVRRGALFLSLENGIVKGLSTAAFADGLYGYCNATFVQKLAWDTLKTLSTGSIKSIRISQLNGYSILSGSVVSIYGVRA